MPIKVFHGTTYAGLLDKIYATTAINCRNFEFNIICRYPISSQECKPIPIKNDEGVELLLEVPSRSGVYCVEIYLEEELASLQIEASALLTKETNAVEVGDDGKNNGETSSKHLNDSSKIDDNQLVLIDRSKWKELNINCLVNVFQKVRMEALLLDVPFVCKSWYKATLNPMCWQHLIFPENLGSFAERIMKEYQKKILITSFIKSIVNRSSRCATTLMLPYCCTEEALEYAAKQYPDLKVFGLHGYLSRKNASVIPNLIRNWKNLEVLRLRRAHNIPEILILIGFHCKNFFQLMLPESYIRIYAASTIVTYLPKIKHLFLKGAIIEKETLVKILQGSKELVRLDVRYCLLFEESDAQVLELASHIPSFRCEGSTDIDNTEDREMQIALIQQDGKNYFWNQDDPFDWNFVN